MKTTRTIIQGRANRLGLTAYSIFNLIKLKHGNVVTLRHIQSYLNGDKDMTSGRLDYVIDVLDLEIRQAGEIAR